MNLFFFIKDWGIHDVARWLKHHGPAQLGGYYQGKNRTIFVDGTLRGPLELNFGVIELECEYCYVNEVDHSATDHRRYPAVQFKLEPLTPTTTKLFYTNYHRTLEPVVDGLLNELLEVSKAGKPKVNGKELIVKDEKILLNHDHMRQYYRYYSVARAEELINAFPDAWKKYSNEGGRWGPGLFVSYTTIVSPTIGRYFSAFKKAGFSKIKEINIP